TKESKTAPFALNASMMLPSWSCPNASLFTSRIAVPSSGRSSRISISMKNTAGCYAYCGKSQSDLQGEAPARSSGHRFVTASTNSLRKMIMNGRTVYRFTVAAFVACFIWTPAFAQSEKISLRLLPRPNQIVRMRMVQQTDVDMSFDSDLSVPATAMVPVTLGTKTVVEITQKSGPANAQGHIEAEITYEEVSTGLTMNGQAMPASGTSASFIGKKVTVTFDEQGSVLDIKVTADVGIPEESFRQMLKSMYGNLPAISLAVGETTTVPLDFTLPLPVQGAPPLKMDGDVKHTLASIEKDASGRIAKFDHSIVGKMLTDV